MFSIPPTLRLSTFYEDIHNWITTGESPIPFDSTDGLCENLIHWVYYHDGSPSDIFRLQDELTDEFLDARRDVSFPFNKGIGKLFRVESESNTMYLNLERLEWIHTHATKVGTTL